MAGFYDQGNAEILVNGNKLTLKMDGKVVGGEKTCNEGAIEIPNSAPISFTFNKEK